MERKERINRIIERYENKQIEKDELLRMIKISLSNEEI